MGGFGRKKNSMKSRLRAFVLGSPWGGQWLTCITGLRIVFHCYVYVLSLCSSCMPAASLKQGTSQQPSSHAMRFAHRPRRPAHVTVHVLGSTNGCTAHPSHKRPSCLTSRKRTSSPCSRGFCSVQLAFRRALVTQMGWSIR